MKRIVILYLLTLCYSNIVAQTASDALRFSTHNIISTARTASIGGAINSFGADHAVISSNPGGLAAFRSGEFSLTPLYSIINSDATLDENSTVEDNENQLRLSHLGFVFHRSPYRKESKWKAFNLGVAYNKNIDFVQKTSYEGESFGSMIQSFQEQINTPDFSGFNPFGSELAVNTDAVFDSGNGFFSSDFDGFDNIPITRSETIERSGDNDDFVISFATNYNHKWMLGATVAFADMEFNQDRTYNETDPDENIPTFTRLTYEESIRTSGNGVQFKLGAIYRISQQLRVGGAVHLPTRYNLIDSFYTSLIYNYQLEGTDTPVLNSALSPVGTFEYRLRTPMRALLSVGYLVKKMGFVSAELEWIDYANAQFDFDPEDNSPSDAAASDIVNNEINELYRSTINFKLGAEFAYKILRIRGGLNINGSPFAEDSNTNSIISTGLGIRLQQFYVDFAYRRLMTEEGFLPYATSFAPQPFVVTNTNHNQLLLTLSFKF